MLQLTYKVRAKNTSAESENRIHDDAVAATYGFRGGLVPGVTVYAYMTAPIVAKFGLKWLERGSMQVRFLKPCYDDDHLTVRATVKNGDGPVEADMRVEGNDGTLCASGLAALNSGSQPLGNPWPEEFPETPMPEIDRRPDAIPESFVVGAPLGTLNETLDLSDTAGLDSINERLTFYRGAKAVAHPFTLLGLVNQALMCNYKLGPWIHASSELVNWSTARDGERISVRSRIRECFERKGNDYVVIDALLLANQQRVVQQVRHTAIYRPRRRQDSGSGNLFNTGSLESLR